MDKLKLKFHKLESSRIDLVSLLENQSKQALTFKVDEKTWSPLQVCFHVIKSEQLTLLSLNKILQQKDNLKRAALLELSEMLL